MAFYAFSNPPSPLCFHSLSSGSCAFSSLALLQLFVYHLPSSLSCVLRFSPSCLLLPLRKLPQGTNPITSLSCKKRKKGRKKGLALRSQHCFSNSSSNVPQHISFPQIVRNSEAQLAYPKNEIALKRHVLTETFLLILYSISKLGFNVKTVT